MSNRLRSSSIALATLLVVALGCRGRIEPVAGVPNSNAPSPAAPDPSASIGKPLDDAAFRVDWSKPEIPSTMKPGATATVRITVTNKSSIEWLDRAKATPGGGGGYAVRLSYRWLKKGEDVPVVEYDARADLSKPLAPGASETLSIDVVAPGKAGDYLLQLDLVQELVSWFEGKGATPFKTPVAVR
jgi:hypothetical protein